MAAIYPFVSARYAVKKDVWKGPDGDVAIEIDYQPGHEYNLDRMIAGVKDSLDYFTKHFGAVPAQDPAHHRVPALLAQRRFAESFPNTVPFNEAIGFTAKVDDDDPKDIDYPYFVTAHEVAHQWWAHQEVPANVQGAEFITESLAEYSALMVLKQKYGDAKMRRFLNTSSTATSPAAAREQKSEQPLLRADGAAYVHYQKGAHVAVRAAGRDRRGGDERRAVGVRERWRFKGPPYATSRDLIAEFRRVTPAEHQGLIDDLFETITFFDEPRGQAPTRASGPTASTTSTSS